MMSPSAVMPHTTSRCPAVGLYGAPESEPLTLMTTGVPDSSSSRSSWNDDIRMKRASSRPLVS